MAQGAAAAAMCARCATPSVYSRPRFLHKTDRRQRLHLLLGHPRVFKACMASNIWNLRPPPV